ncbi:acyltransferase family protein [Algibacter pacificus]|uniref:acyltransferase family protein n=1 Tax=Algibacter pacificus TaxID=2599389 RepID=UPI0011C9BFE8|nr:acyltransferase [Algibacter pacificus]
MMNKKLQKLEAIRGFSALYVVLFHTLPQKIDVLGINIGILFRFGSEAVMLFFILSGFVIKYTWEKSKDKSFKTYFLKRFVRIYMPLFFIFLLAYFIKSYNEGHLANPNWKTLLGNIFMLQDVISLKPNVISGVYMGNGVLWSLSYEWWFYMLFFVLSKKNKPSKINAWVNGLTIIATVSYLIYPFFINRIVMYFAIWWIGVRFADIYMKGVHFTFKSIKNYAYILITIITLLALNLYINFNYTKVYNYPLVAYPFIELRHFVFAFLAMFASIIWNGWNWFGFNEIFGVFKYLAPFSYGIYISHHYLVVEADYLKYIDNKIIEYTGYILFMFLFSYLLEVVIYGKMKKWVISFYAIKL